MLNDEVDFKTIKLTTRNHLINCLPYLNWPRLHDSEQFFKEIAAEFGDQVEIVTHTGPGDPEWGQYAINNAPALVVGDLVKFVGLAPSKKSLVGALREAGLS